MANKYMDNVSLKELATSLIKGLSDYPGNDAFDAESTKRLLNALNDFSASLNAEITNTREEYEQQVARIAVDTLKKSSQIDHVLIRNGKDRYAGALQIEFYASYDDELDRKDINTILDADDPNIEFAGKIEDAYIGEYSRTVESLENEVKDAVQMELGGVDDIDDIVSDSVAENIIFQYPFEHYLNQEVRVPIMLDTGDAGYDYTLNRLMAPDAEHPSHWMHEHSSALWLAKQQGYTEAQLVEALQTENTDDIKDEFLRDLCVEMDSVVNRVGQLVFLTKLTVKELLALNMAMKTGEGSITITDPYCGLFDKVNGAGGMDLSVSKPVEIPVKFIQSAKVDVPHDISTVWNYGIQETFDFIGEVWKDSSQLKAKFDFPKADTNAFGIDYQD